MSKYRGTFDSAIVEGAAETDAELLRKHSLTQDLSGSTGCFVFLTKNEIVCGNVGDSRAIMSVEGDVIELSRDHKPESEREWIEVPLLINRLLHHLIGGWR